MGFLPPTGVTKKSSKAVARSPKTCSLVCASLSPELPTGSSSRAIYILVACIRSHTLPSPPTHSPSRESFYWGMTQALPPIPPLCTPLFCPCPADARAVLCGVFKPMCVGLFRYVTKKIRLTGSQLQFFLQAQRSINNKFNAELVTEFSFNTIGILEKVCLLDYRHGDDETFVKGTPSQPGRCVFYSQPTAQWSTPTW